MRSFIWHISSRDIDYSVNFEKRIPNRTISLNTECQSFFEKMFENFQIINTKMLTLSGSWFTKTFLILNSKIFKELFTDF
jgi:hypothetical protein